MLEWRRSLTLGVVRQREQADAGGTNARTEDSDAQGVAAKEGDVFADPTQSLDLVQQPIVALGSLVPGAQESCRQDDSSKMGSTGPKAILACPRPSCYALQRAKATAMGPSFSAATDPFPPSPLNIAEIPHTVHLKRTSSHWPKESFTPTELPFSACLTNCRVTGIPLGGGGVNVL